MVRRESGYDVVIRRLKKGKERVCRKEEDIQESSVQSQKKV